MRIGVFFLLAFLLAAGFSFADEGGISGGEENIELRVETSPANPLVNNPWSVYVLVNHPHPQEVNVDPPLFSSSLALERVRIDTRTMAQDERWTRTEFLFVPLRAGEITLLPFEVTTPKDRAYTAVFTVRFRELTAVYEPRFRWLGAAPAVFPGEKAELRIELTNWDPNKKTPQGFFRGKAPPNAIVEEGAPQAAGEGLYRYSINVTALEGSSVTLEAFSFQSDNYSLSIPRIIVPVLPGQPQASAASGNDTDSEPAESQQEGIQQESTLPIPFPVSGGKVFFLFQGEYDQIVARAGALWNENQRAEALAELRKNERDSFCGPFLAPLRRELEQGMNLGFTEDESWRPLRIFPVLCAVFFILVIFLIVSLRVLRLRPGILVELRQVIFRRKNSIVKVIVLILAAGAALLFLDERLENFPASRSENAAVLKNTQSYRVPDLRGAVNDSFSEGQPVILSAYSEGWCLAETPDGRSGWVRRESVITY
jgi:hypothetical protein